MKIRYGFVSNSSSSSSIVLGRSIKFEDLLDRKSNFPVYMLGEFMNEGMDFFQITPDILEKMKSKRWHCDDYQYVEVYRLCDDGDELNTKKLPSKFQIFSFDQDYSNTETPEDFEERYMRTGDD